MSKIKRNRISTNRKRLWKRKRKRIFLERKENARKSKRLIENEEDTF